MKKVLLASIVSAAIVGGGFLIQSVTAHNPNFENLSEKPGFEQMIEKKAEFLGLDADELELQLEEKTFVEIMEENGITHEQLFEAKLEKIREMMEEKGYSDEEIEEKMTWMQEHFENRQEKDHKDWTSKKIKGFGWHKKW